MRILKFGRSARLSAGIFKVLKNLNDYGFRDQISRSGLSVPSNIAEGFERSSVKECLVFLSYARGSSGELRTQIYIGMEVGYNLQKLVKAGFRKPAKFQPCFLP